MNKYEVLKYYFNFNSFRYGQEDIVDSILNNVNTLAILATGGGKSLCFQVPALVFSGITIVISPLISLMEDQVRNLKKKGISAEYINSSLDRNRQIEILNSLKEYKIKLLYIAPEKIQNKTFLNLLSDLNVSQIVLDEAHSLSLYGHDFRPDYKNVCLLFNKIKSKPVLSLFSATASEEVVSDIKNILNVDIKIFKFGFDRPNLFYSKIEAKDKFSVLLDILNKNKDISIIIYALTRRECEVLYKKLKEYKFLVSIYHAGLLEETKKENNLSFLLDQTNIMIATNAYGMGIDKPNIRLVINYGFPMSLEDLSQQQGRCSRDGKNGKCILIYNMKDLHANNYFISKVDDNINLSEAEKKIVKKTKLRQLNEVIGYGKTKRCLHEYIVSHFGELFESNCNNCINCLNKNIEKDYLKEACLVVSAIKETGEHFGSTIISKIITGSLSQEIKERKLNRLKTYNKTIKNIDEIKNVIINMVLDGYLDKTFDEYPVLKLNEKSETIFDKDKYMIKK